MSDTDSDRENTTAIDFNYEFVDLLKEHAMLLSKSQTLRVKLQKVEALQSLINTIESKCGKSLTGKQIMKKINNMKTIVKKKTDAKATGNKSVKLLPWEMHLHELLFSMDGNPSVMKVPGQSESFDTNVRKEGPKTGEDKLPTPQKRRRVVQRPQRSTSKILDTPLSEESCHSESHIGEAHPFSVQDESPASLQGASVDVTTASVHGTSFSQSLPISHPNGRGDSSTFVDGSELPQCHSKHSRNEDVIENKNYIDGVFQKLNDISEKFNLLPQTEDSFDHFGRYVASRLRSISSQNALILQKKIIDFILESHMETVQDNQRVEKSVNEISETVLSEITNNSGSHLEDNDSITIEIESLHDSPSLMDMTSSVTHVPPHSPLMTTTLPTKSINMSGTTNIRASGPKSQSRDRRKCEAFVGASESSEYQNKNSRSDDFMQHEYIDGVLQKLNEMSVKFSLFPQREDGLDYFGRYVVSLLRSLPPQRAFFIQKKIIDLIFLEQYVVL